MSKSFRVRCVAGLLGSVFLWAAVSKIIDTAAFISTIEEFGLVWEPLLSLSAWVVIGAEAVAAAGLWCGRRWAARLAGGLLVVFLCVLAYGILLGLDIECGCFGTGEGTGSLTLKQAAVLDVVLLATCLGLEWAMRKCPGGQATQQTASVAEDTQEEGH